MVDVVIVIIKKMLACPGHEQSVNPNLILPELQK
jgi:hypothetical protein